MEVSQDPSPSITAVTSGKSHTPGPWEVSGSTGYGDINGHRVREPRGYILAVAIGDVPELHSEANAHLIAAAPDLLKALKGVLEACLYAEDDGQIGVTFEPSLYDQQFDAICAAIAKAEGRS